MGLSEYKESRRSIDPSDSRDIPHVLDDVSRFQFVPHSPLFVLINVFIQLLLLRICCTKLVRLLPWGYFDVNNRLSFFVLWLVDFPWFRLLNHGVERDFGVFQFEFLPDPKWAFSIIKPPQILLSRAR